MPVSAAAIAWFHEDDYDRLLELFEDAEKLPRTYSKWLAGANNGIQQLQSKGHVAIKAYITPDEFIAWCSTRNLKLNASARMKFASEVAAKYLNDPRHIH